MRKHILCDPYQAATGEPTIQVVGWRRGDGRLGIEKQAFAEGHSPIYDFLRTVQPEEGSTFLLIIALSSWEFYGQNRNADTFPERPVEVGRRALCGHPECTRTLDGWVSEPETITHHYKTFESHGKLFRHHANNDPSKAIGSLSKAVWNARMHRVELLAKLTNRLAPDAAQKLGDHEGVAGSMGCRVRWDVCSICGHRAPTRAQYCDHARNQLGSVLPDGRVIAVHNPSPVLFDYSLVIKPADKTAWSLMKVAESLPYELSAAWGEALDLADSRASELTRTAHEIREAWTSPESFLGAFAKTAAGPLTPIADLTLERLPQAPRLLAQGEIAKLAGLHYGLELPEYVVDRLVVATPALISLLGAQPTSVKQADLGYMGDVMRQRVYDPERPWSPLDGGPGAAYRASEPAKTELLSMTDPYTGHSWQTTRGAAQEAATKDTGTRLWQTALFTALYGAGIHKLLKGRSGVGGSLALGLIPGIATERYLHHTFRPYHSPYYLTDQGIPVSGGTEFKEAQVTPTTWAAKLAADMTERGGVEALYARLQGTPFAKWAALPLAEQVSTLTRYDVPTPKAVSWLLTS